MERSMLDIEQSCWSLAFNLAYEDGDTRKPTDHWSHGILDFMPGFMDKWVNCRMSPAMMLKWTPEKVESRLLAIERLLKRDTKRTEL